MLDPNNRAAYSLSASTGALGLFNYAPHPNAAKLLANWLLSQEGQATWSENVGDNSRRSDVAPSSETDRIDPSRRYINMQLEENYPLQVKFTDIAIEVLK